MYWVSESKGWVLTLGYLIATITHSRMKMGGYFHGFYYQIAKKQKITWCHHGVSGKPELESTYKAINIAGHFMKEVFWPIGILKTIILDQDEKSTSKLWKALFEGLDTQLGFSTAYHS